MTIHVIALPGGVNPAALRYGPVQAALGDEVQLHWKDLEVYETSRPSSTRSSRRSTPWPDSPTHSSSSEFHLLGYSGGGFVSLAFAAAHPERLTSLALFEPASIPGPLSTEEAALKSRLDEALRGIEPERFMSAFVNLQVRPGVAIDPPSGSAPPWMAERPAGLAAMMRAFTAHPFDRESLRRVAAPVFLGHGELTGVQEEVRAGVLARLMPDISVRRFAGIHHFVPVDRLYTPEHLDRLRCLWTTAERDA